MAARKRLLTVRVDDEEFRRFEAVAEDMGLDVSAMIRALVREREKKNEAEAPRKRRTTR